VSAPPEVTDDQIYADLQAYQDAGMVDYVLPTDPIGEQWIVGWNGQILKFVTKEGIVGFLCGVQVAAVFAASLKPEIIGYRAGGVLYHPDDVLIVRAGLRKDGTEGSGT
jgi:hypothetical protein